MRLSLFFAILLSFQPVLAHWTCGEAFSNPAIGFFKYLVDGIPENRFENTPSVDYLGIQKDGRLAFRQRRAGLFFKRKGWSSSYNLIPGSSTPQGDLRNFIYLVGPRLAHKFGFEFREDLTGVTLLVPTAARIEKVIRTLNAYLIKNNKEPIAYLPKQSEFLNAGETLQLANGNNGEDGILVQFPYADKDIDLAPHEVAYHLGPIIFSNVIHRRTAQLNHAVQSAARLLIQSGLPNSKEISTWLIEKRELEMDLGYGNMQLELSNNRRKGSLAQHPRSPFISSLVNIVKNDVGILLRPSYTPEEYIARRLVVFLGLERYFPSQEFLQVDVDAVGKVFFNEDIDPTLKLPRAEAETYIPFIRKILERVGTSQNIFPRTSPKEFAQQYLTDSIERRIRELNDAFDAIGYIP